MGEWHQGPGVGVLNSIYIRLDGTSTTTAVIPFAEGVSIADTKKLTFMTMVEMYGDFSLRDFFIRGLQVAGGEGVTLFMTAGQSLSGLGGYYQGSGGEGSTDGGDASFSGGKGNNGRGGCVFLHGGGGTTSDGIVVVGPTFTPAHGLNNKYDTFLSGKLEVTGNSYFDSQIQSFVSTGTSPFSIASTTLNTNLNVDLLDGLHATDLVPPGTMFDYGGFTAPIGFLMCIGTAYSRTTYSALFAAITITQTGTLTNGSPIVTGLSDTSNMGIGMPVSGVDIPASTKILTVDSGTQITLDKNATANNTEDIVIAPYGVGNGSTTFNVPDCRGRAKIGAGTGSGLTSRVLGINGGEETHVLTIAELAQHSHTTQYYATSVTQTKNNYGIITGAVSVVTNITTAFGSGTNNAGSSSAHNNMQPFIAVNVIIKY